MEELETIRRKTVSYGISAALLGALALSGCAETGSETAAKDQPERPDTASAGGAADRGARVARAFPAQSSRVLGTAGGLEIAAIRDGFEGQRGAARFGSVRVTLPADGRDAVHVRAGDLDIRVREEGASGQGAIVQRAVAYERAGGASFWTASDAGAEEWLHLSASAVTAGKPAAAWEIEGARAEANGGAVALVDAQGVARVWVTAPEAYARDGRQIQARLAVEGSRIDLYVDADGEEVLVDPGWAAAAPMLAPRAGHLLQALENGQVLAAGGIGLTNGNIDFLAAAELYDPAANKWKQLPPMSAKRYLASPVLLPSGKVLVAGGSDMNAGIASGELFDPATGTWSPGGTFATGRGLMGMAPLPGGKYLFAGGFNPAGFLADASIYDPATNTWAAAAPMSSQRGDPAIWPLPDGKVLVAGGAMGSVMTPTIVATAEIYDPVANTWSPAPPMPTARYGSAFAVLPNGKLIDAGGIGKTLDPISAVDIYDPALGTWSSGPPLGSARAVPTGTLLLDGTFLVAGGGAGTQNAIIYLASAEIYSPAMNTWTAAGSMGSTRYVAAAARLQNGEVLVNGGLNDQQPPTLSSGDRYSYNIDGGKPCAVPGDCLTGFCTDGVCCVVAACPPPGDACHSQGTCTAGTGMCSNPAKADGTACDDGNACTQMDTCQTGACTGASPVMCAAMDACHAAGTCDPKTGMCSNPMKVDGASCDDGDPCTTADKCQAGACTAGTKLACNAKDECHVPGTCDSKTGMCDNPEKVDGLPCTGGVCKAGACVSDMGTGGPGGAGGDAGAGGTGASTGTGGSGGHTVKGGCGCRVADTDAPSVPAGALGLFLGALVLARRRRSAPSLQR